VPEYIIPQFFLQWVRESFESNNILYAIRYFSCRRSKVNDFEYNYVFPVVKSSEQGFCTVLTKAFSVTCPVLLRDYNNAEECENSLKGIEDLACIQ